MAICRWGNLEKVIVQDFQCQAQLGIEISKMRRQSEISVTLIITLCPRPFWPAGNSLKSFTIEFVRPCEPVSVNCPSEPEKLRCLDIIQINEATEATKLQPLSQDIMEQQSASKETCKLSLKVAPSQEFHSYIKNAKKKTHSIDNLTNNNELETFDGQLRLSLQHQPRLRT